MIEWTNKRKYFYRNSIKNWTTIFLKTNFDRREYTRKIDSIDYFFFAATEMKTKGTKENIHRKIFGMLILCFENNLKFFV